MLVNDVNIFIHLFQISEMIAVLGINRIKELEQEKSGTGPEQGFILGGEGQVEPGHGFEETGMRAPAGGHDQTNQRAVGLLNGGLALHGHVVFMDPDLDGFERGVGAEAQNGCYSAGEGTVFGG